MSLALALSLALFTQQAATTEVTQVDGTMQFQLYWDYDTNALLLELTGATITDINGAKPLGPVSIKFEALQLNLPPEQNLRSPYLGILSNQNGTASLYYQYSSINYGVANATLGFTFGGAYPDLMTPYSFNYFNYGAFQYFTLYPATGDGQDIASVLSGKLAGVSGTGTLTDGPLAL